MMIDKNDENKNHNKNRHKQKSILKVNFKSQFLKSILTVNFKIQQSAAPFGQSVGP